MSRAVGFPTFEANKIGVRRVYTLGFLGTAPDPDTISALIANGYDSGTINTMAALGATDEQLLALPYPASSDEMAAGISNLMNILGGGVAGPGRGASTAQSYPQSALIPANANPWGTAYDLTQEASWNAIGNLFTMVQQQLNQIAQMAPNDPDVISHVTQFNSLVVQWAGYYQQAFGSSPSPLPMASIPGGGSMSGTLGVIPVVVAVAAIGGITVLLVGLYGFYTWGQTKKAQITATAQVQTAANTAAITAAQNTSSTLLTQANSLLSSANALPASQAAQAAAMRQQAAQMQAQAGALVSSAIGSTTNPGQPSQLTNWFTQNWIGIAAVLVGMVVLPPLIKKL